MSEKYCDRVASKGESCENIATHTNTKYRCENVSDTVYGIKFTFSAKGLVAK